MEAVERIEVLKDGASSTYGADPIAGVVNIILRKDVFIYIYLLFFCAREILRIDTIQCG